MPKAFRPKDWSAERIFTLRRSLGWTQEQMAQALNVSMVTISRWERDTAGPSRLAMEKLSQLWLMVNKKSGGPS